MNNVILTGRITRDLELKTGKASYLKFSLAVNRPFSKDEVDFINCAAFGKTAELMDKYLSKGSKIGVIGRIQVSQYEKEGQKHSNTEIVVDTLEFLESKKETTTEPKVEENFNEEEFPF